jgi:methanogenic corrinoid protein MtbC1
MSEAQLAMTSAAISGDAGRLYRLVGDLLDEGTPFDVVLFDILGPAEGDLGGRWQQGDYLISEEHAATATIETVVALLAGSLDQPDEGPRVVVAAAEGDNHSLPGRMANAYLLYLGFRTTHLGGSVLATDLGEYLADDQPDALILSCAMTVHLVGARSTIEASHAAGVPVIVGGRAFDEQGVRARAVGADAWAASPRDLPGILESWDPAPAAAEEAAVQPTEELLEITRRHREIVTSALAEIPVSPPGSGGVRLVAELDLLLGAVEASLLVDDQTVVDEMVAWQAETLHAHGHEDGTAVATALGSALRAVSPRAAAKLAEAAADISQDR